MSGILTTNMSISPEIHGNHFEETKRGLTLKWLTIFCDESVTIPKSQTKKVSRLTVGISMMLLASFCNSRPVTGGPRQT